MGAAGEDPGWGVQSCPLRPQQSGTMSSRSIPAAHLVWNCGTLGGILSVTVSSTVRWEHPGVEVRLEYYRVDPEKEPQ